MRFREKMVGTIRIDNKEQANGKSLWFSIKLKKPIPLMGYRFNLLGDNYCPAELLILKRPAGALAMKPFTLQ